MVFDNFDNFVVRAGLHATVPVTADTRCVALCAPPCAPPCAHFSTQSYMESDFYTNEALPALAEASTIMLEDPHVQSFVYADSTEEL